MSILEIVGFISGILGVYFTIKENIWCFPIGILNVFLSMILFYNQHLYADTLQQIVYLILISYGWFFWNCKQKETILPVSRSSNKLLLYCFFLAIFVSALIGTLLYSYTKASFPWLDATATSASFVAQWLIAKKKIENWFIWMAVNIIYIGIYINKELYLYSILFLVYFILAIWGHKQWKLQLNNNEQTN